MGWHAARHCAATTGRSDLHGTELHRLGRSARESFEYECGLCFKTLSDHGGPYAAADRGAWQPGLLAPSAPELAAFEASHDTRLAVILVIQGAPIASVGFFHWHAARQVCGLLCASLFFWLTCAQRRQSLRCGTRFAIAPVARAASRLSGIHPRDAALHGWSLQQVAANIGPCEAATIISLPRSTSSSRLRMIWEFLATVMHLISPDFSSTAICCWETTR